MALSGLLQRNQPPAQWITRSVIAVAVVALVVSLAANILVPILLSEGHPLWVVALNPTNSNLLLAQGVDAVPYYLVGFIRHISTDPFYYLIGLWYSDKAIGWISKRSKSFAQIFEESENFIKVMAGVFVFTSPVSIVCLVAGGVELKFKKFIVLDALGTIASLVLVRWLGERFEGPVDGIRDFIVTYWWQATALTVLYVLFTLFKDTRSGSGSTLAFLKKLGKKS